MLQCTGYETDAETATHFGGEGDFDDLARSEVGVVGRDLDTCSKACLMLPKFSLRWLESNSTGARASDTGPPLILLQLVEQRREEERRKGKVVIRGLRAHKQIASGGG